MVIGGATVSDTAPANPVPGQLWVESDSGAMFVRWADANSEQWVQVNPSLDTTGLVKKTGDTMSGNLTISKSNALFVANKLIATENAGMEMQKAGVTRWMIAAAGTPETGSNAGSDLYFARYTDAGAYIDAPMVINRGDGGVNVYTNLTLPASTGRLTLGSLGEIMVGRVTYAFNQNNGMTFQSTNGLMIENTSIPLHVSKIGANGWVLLAYQSAVSVGGIQVLNGNATAFLTSSDGRLKEDLQPFDAGPILDATDVYDFAWKGQEARGYGVIAQEAITVFPDAIAHLEEDDTWGADYSKYVPLLIQEVKALRARVAELEGR
jgi:hypothetical protein